MVDGIQLPVCMLLYTIKKGDDEYKRHPVLWQSALAHLNAYCLISGYTVGNQVCCCWSGCMMEFPLHIVAFLHMTLDASDEQQQQPATRMSLSCHNDWSFSRCARLAMDAASADECSNSGSSNSKHSSHS